MTQAAKTAIVTGANRGIGREIARQLLAAGFRVIVAARDPAKGAKAAEELGAGFLQLDLSDPQSILHFGKAAKEKYGKIDVLINNAGIIGKDDNRLLEASLSLVNETFSTNAIGPLLLTQTIAPLMPAGGRVIMISSGGGSMSDPVGGWSPVYCVSKSLLNAITRQLASELKSAKISVNAICPGWVRTDMGGNSAPRSVGQGADTAAWLATTNENPTGKFFRDRKEIPF